jgi:hypothetical protein
MLHNLQLLIAGIGLGYYTAKVMGRSLKEYWVELLVFGGLFVLAIFN